MNPSAEGPAPAESDRAAVAPRRFPCEKCGADLEFAAGTEALVCPWCGTRNAIERGGEVISEIDFRETLDRLAEEAPTEAATLLKCQACAAEIARPEHVTSLACPWCGSAMVASDAPRRLIRPKSLLPFHVAAEAAREAWRTWLARRWFAPGDLRRFASSEGRLQGVYVPYWTYDSRTTTEYTGQRGDDYWVTVGSGKNRRTVRRTRWHGASGTVSNEFDDMLVAATQTLPAKHLDRLEPWDLANLVPYRDDYLVGFSAECYQIDLAAGFAVAWPRMELEIRTTIETDIGGDHQRIDSMNTTFRSITFKHLLLPVWVSAYRYRNKLFRVVVNARTGEVHGERPWSVWKIVFAILGAAAAAGVVFVLVRVFGN